MRRKIKPSRGKVTGRGTRGAFGKSRINSFLARHKVTVAMQCALAKAQLINTARATSGIPYLTKEERMAIYDEMRALHGDKPVTTSTPRWKR
jgi:hypothetical protein